MCKFILGTVPRETDLSQLEVAIPMTIRRRLIHLGSNEYAPPKCVAIEEVTNPFVVDQLPGNDLLIRLTRFHCDCWSDLGRRKNLETPSKENQRWLALLRLWIRQGFSNRIGLFIHFGDPSDGMALDGPIVHEVNKVNVTDLEMWDWDTIHEFVA